MHQVETLARHAWQLRQQGYSIDAIADAMGKPFSAIERWILRWASIASSEPPWYDGLHIHIVSCLRHVGIDSREALVKAWEAGEIRRGQPAGIGVSRLLELRHWLAATGSDVAEVPTKAVIVELSAEAEASLQHLKPVSGRSSSDIISELLVLADPIDRR
jgi:hypothetical protein